MSEDVRRRGPRLGSVDTLVIVTGGSAGLGRALLAHAPVLRGDADLSGNLTMRGEEAFGDEGGGGV